MVFSSLTFICIFMPVVFLLHCILPGVRAKNAMLLITGLLFYAYGEPIYVLLMIGSAFGNYLLAMMIGGCQEKEHPGGAKVLIALAVILNLAVLVVFKYTGFLVESANALFHLTIPVPVISLPIGISFFTFQAMSYVIDVYRRVDPPQKNFGKVLLYISFFPQLIAGPIVKYHDIALELSERRQTAEGIHAGMRRFIAGLAKKVLIANTMAAAVDTLLANGVSGMTAGAAWIAAVSYLMQIYFDFSGYSDMAIGMGWMFGFHFKENFNYPYISGSVQEFWRRWHISLSGWFKEYLYIPLGGNRKGKLRTVINKMIVFLGTGIWHGANLTFLIWGLYHGCLLLLEEYVPASIKKLSGPVVRILSHAYTLMAVLLGFVIFRADNLMQGLRWIKAMFTGFTAEPAWTSLVRMQMTPLYLTTLAAAIIFAAPVTVKLKKIKGYEAAADVLSLAALAMCILSLAGGTYNPFIYFRF